MGLVTQALFSIILITAIHCVYHRADFVVNISNPDEGMNMAEKLAKVAQTIHHNEHELDVDVDDDSGFGMGDVSHFYESFFS